MSIVVSSDTYLGAAIYFATTGCLFIASIFHPVWLVVSSPEPFKTRVTYNLFKRCTLGSCRAFPQASYGDCGDDLDLPHVTALSTANALDTGMIDDGSEFCSSWQAARLCAIGAIPIGILLLFNVILTALSRSHIRKTYAWKSIALYMFSHAACILLSTMTINKLSKTSARFYFDTSFGIGFYMAYGTWIAEITGLLLFLVMVFLSRPTSPYEEF
jgi:hypothetical protein